MVVQVSIFLFWPSVVLLFPGKKPSPMTNSMSLELFSLIRLCEYRVKVVSLYEPHALNLQAIFYQSHTLFHQCMTKKNHRKQRRTKGRKQVLLQTRNKIKEKLRTSASKLDYRGTPCKKIWLRSKANVICNDFVQPVGLQKLSIK